MDSFLINDMKDALKAVEILAQAFNTERIRKGRFSCTGLSATA